MHLATPLVPSPTLSRDGSPVLLKLDALQPSGSFKLRGIGRLVQSLVAGGARRLFAASGGNAGLAVAYAGRALSVPVTVVVPSTTSKEMAARIAAYGATVEVHGDDFDGANAHALGLVDQHGGAYVHPFDHPEIWRGHATLVEELVQAGVHPSVIVLSVGGGGLMSGVVEGLRQHGMQDVPIIAVETAGAASLAAAVRAGRLVTLDRITTIATTLGARTVAAQTLFDARSHPCDVVTITDADATSACVRFCDDHRILVEPACGAALSIAYTEHPRFMARRAERADRPAVVIVCGGVAVSPKLIEAWRMSGSAS